MKFVTNKINLQPGDFADFTQKILAKKAEEMVKTAEKDEAPSSGQPEAEAKLVNDPKKEKGKSGKADNSEAPSSGQPEAEAKLVNEPKVECDTKEEVKEAGGVENFGDKQAKPFGSEKKDDDDKDDDNDDDKESETKEEDDEKDEEKEASQKISFIKLSALNAPTKEMLRTYWRTLYPADYVDAMLAEK